MVPSGPAGHRQGDGGVVKFWHRRQEDRERLQMYEAEEIERNEIFGEHLAALDAKGYEIHSHMCGPCFPCTLSSLIDGLPSLKDRSMS